VWNTYNRAKPTQEVKDEDISEKKENAGKHYFMLKE
jgi:hypothetical protein